MSFIFVENCYCHILRNGVKHAHGSLSINIEQILLTIYSHFSRSAKRIDDLKPYYEFYEQDFKVIFLYCYYYPYRYIIDNIFSIFIIGYPKTYQNQVVESVFINWTFTGCVCTRAPRGMGQSHPIPSHPIPSHPSHGMQLF